MGGKKKGIIAGIIAIVVAVAGAICVVLKRKND